ncbi:MAG: Cytochrome c4, partial [uncultured Acetobacteraceae bacterium]
AGVGGGRRGPRAGACSVVGRPARRAALGGGAVRGLPRQRRHRRAAGSAEPCRAEGRLHRRAAPALPQRRAEARVDDSGVAGADGRAHRGSRRLVRGDRGASDGAGPPL